MLNSLSYLDKESQEPRTMSAKGTLHVLIIAKLNL